MMAQATAATRLAFYLLQLGKQLVPYLTSLDPCNGHFLHGATLEPDLKL